MKSKLPTPAPNALRVAPIVSDARYWRHVVTQLQTECPHADAILQILILAKRNEVALIPPVVAAWAIAQRPELLESTAPLRIAILGASETDSGIDGRLYRLIPWLLSQPDRVVEVEVVGPELQRFSFPTDSLADELPPTDLYPVSCGQWWAERPAATPPDLMILFHPGFESHVDSWFEIDELPMLLKTKIPVLAFSYDADEAERDCAILRAMGASTEPSSPCPFALHDQASHEPLHRFEFGRASYRVTQYREQEPNTLLIEAILGMTRAMAQTGMTQGSQFLHQDAWRPCFMRRGEQLCTVLHVFDRIYYDPQAKELFIGLKGRQLEDMAIFDAGEVDVLGGLATLHTPLERALSAFSLYRMLVPPHEEEDVLQKAASMIDALLDAHPDNRATAKKALRGRKTKSKKKSRGRK